MSSFPEAPRKSKLPGYLSYPVGYTLIREELEPHLPSESFALRFSGFDNRLPHDRGFSPIRICELRRSPDHWLDSLWNEASWVLSVYGALRIDREQIVSAMVETGFAELIKYLEMPRTELWKDLAFSRTILWDRKRRLIVTSDRNQLERKHA